MLIMGAAQLLACVIQDEAYVKVESNVVFVPEAGNQLRLRQYHR